MSEKKEIINNHVKKEFKRFFGVVHGNNRNAA